MKNIFPSGSGARGDAELVSAARAGDADAYAQLTARHTDAARRLARQLVTTDEVDKLVAEAFAKVRLVLQHGDGPDLAFRPYLLTAVRRLHVDHAKDVPATPDDAAAARAFTALPEAWRLVLWHTEVERQKPEAVAALLGEAPASMPALVARAREGMHIALMTRHEVVTDKECEWTRHNLGAYVRKVSFDRDAARVEQHLGSCEECAAIAAGLTEGTKDLRGILASLVLASSAAGYLAAPASEAVVRAARPKRRAGTPVAGVTGVFGRGFNRVRDGAAGATGRVGDQLGRAKDLVRNRAAATAVAGVAAVAIVAGGVFVVGQAADGPVEASAEAPAGVVLDDETSEATESESVETDASGIGRAAETELSAEPSDDPTASATSSASADPSDGVNESPSTAPTAPGPGRPNDGPTRNPTQAPTHQPTQQPTHQPTQTPTQSPTQPTQPPAPPMDLAISASSQDLAGLLWGIDVRITGLTPGQSATLTMRSSGGNGRTTDSRCTAVGNGGANCWVTNTPSTYHFNASAFLSGSNTLTFTVTSDSAAESDTSNNSVSVIVRP